MKENTTSQHENIQISRNLTPTDSSVKVQYSSILNQVEPSELRECPNSVEIRRSFGTYNTKIPTATSPLLKIDHGPLISTSLPKFSNIAGCDPIILAAGTTDLNSKNRSSADSKFSDSTNSRSSV
ncbi:hypothetical protein BB561_002694 [Smittium simulii]|uniref:Uncharacterized protein n=1 Tax=Smittium simulii TaxID=133385 RepID=A0A2T9YPI9_9FUNG|nr:hypothetical protein BB561_002694 [Smittium simulii]